MNCTSTVYENRLRHRITMLEDSLARVSSTRKELRDHVDVVKYEIRETFGQQLNRLRNREQQILEKLDTVACVKDNILCQQQDHLHQALGACTQGLQWLQTAYEDVKNDKLTSMESVEKRISEILNQYNSVDFMPRETSFVAFESDAVSLRRSIASFGQIRSAGIVRNSESLPCAMEDYDDEQHEHTLSHKSVHSAAKPINVINMGRPILSNDSTKEWLLKEALTSPAAFNEQPMQAHKRSSISCQSIDDACSTNSHRTTQIHNWLHQIKNSVENEPVVFDHFEISKKLFKVNSFETLDPVSKEALFRKHFEQVIFSPDKSWLFDKQGKSLSNISDASKVDSNEQILDDVISCTNSSFTTRRDSFLFVNSAPPSVDSTKMSEEENALFKKYAEYWRHFLDQLWASSDSLWLLPCASGDDPVMVPSCPTSHCRPPSWMEVTMDASPLEIDSNASLPKNFVAPPSYNSQCVLPDDVRFSQLDLNKPFAADQSNLSKPRPDQSDFYQWLLTAHNETALVDSKRSPAYFSTTMAANETDWRWTVTDFRSTATATAAHPPPSNETTSGAESYEEVLGWRAVLEKVHGLGDEKWLMMPMVNKRGGCGSAAETVSGGCVKTMPEDALFSGYPIPDMCPF